MKNWRTGPKLKDSKRIRTCVKAERSLQCWTWTYMYLKCLLCLDISPLLLLFNCSYDVNVLRWKWTENRAFWNSEVNLLIETQKFLLCRFHVNQLTVLSSTTALMSPMIRRVAADCWCVRWYRSVRSPHVSPLMQTWWLTACWRPVSWRRAVGRRWGRPCWDVTTIRTRRTWGTGSRWFDLSLT